MEKSKIINKKARKAQGWGMDFIIAVSIFTFGLVAFYIYSLNSPGEAKEKIEALYYDGKILANTVLSDGAPESWNTTNVIKIGVLRNDKINETKLGYFYNLTNATAGGYEETKKLFDITYDYYFFLSERMVFNNGMGGGFSIDGIGKPGVNRTIGFEDAKNLVKITRYVVYDNKPMAAYFYIWEEG